MFENTSALKNEWPVVHQNVNSGYLNVRITGNLCFLCFVLFCIFCYLKQTQIIIMIDKNKESTSTTSPLVKFFQHINEYLTYSVAHVYSEL